MPQERNKMMGSEKSGNVPMIPFFFPDDGPHPAVTVEARSRVEAEKMVAVLRGQTSDNSEE